MRLKVILLGCLLSLPVFFQGNSAQGNAAAAAVSPTIPVYGIKVVNQYPHDNG